MFLCSSLLSSSSFSGFGFAVSSVFLLVWPERLFSFELSMGKLSGFGSFSGEPRGFTVFWVQIDLLILCVRCEFSEVVLNSLSSVFKFNDFD